MSRSVQLGWCRMPRNSHGCYTQFSVHLKDPEDYSTHRSALNSHMVSSEPLDKSPPLLPIALTASGSFSLSSSGSLQTHLSSFNSEQRLRSLPSVAGDLENQADSGSDDFDDGVHNGDNRQLTVKQRIWWLMRVFVWFSALFFPISLLGNYGFLSRRPSVNTFSVDYEPGLLSIGRGVPQLTRCPGYLPSLWENERLSSKITTLSLQPSRFRYSIFDGFYNSHDLTACVWFNVADFDDTSAWLRGWPGGFYSLQPWISLLT